MYPPERCCTARTPASRSIWLSRFRYDPVDPSRRRLEDDSAGGILVLTAAAALRWSAQSSPVSERRLPDYWDFVYFSFVSGMMTQVSDVAIASKTIRRTATAHGIVWFVFNTALLALTVNIAGSAT